MKKIFGDYRYIVILVGIIISFLSLLSLCFIHQTLYFTIALVLNILVNFIVSALVLTSDLRVKEKFLSILGYLIITQIFLNLDVLVMKENIDLNVYSNVMYVTNVELYLAIYSAFVGIMSLFSGYVLLKYFTKNQK